EAIAGALERAAGAMPSVRPMTGVGAENRESFIWRETPCNVEQLIVGQIRECVERGRNDLRFPMRIEVRQRDLVARLRFDGSEIDRDLVELFANAGEVLAPASAPFRLIDAGKKRRNHLSQLAEHLV